MRRSVALLCVLLFTVGVRAGEVETHKDLPYVEGDDADPIKQKLDLFVPKGAKDCPVVVWVHGGAWVIGDRKQYGSVGEMFARNGVATAVISYRLAPKFPHPAQIEDTAKAFAWVKKNVAKYGGNPDQVFVAGHSAGGHLAALLATDETYLKAEKLSLADVKGVIPVSGVYVISGAIAAPIFGTDADGLKMASPVEHVKEKHPPFLIMWADKDLAGLAKMAEKLCDKLKEAKCDAESLVLKDRNHVTLVSNMRKDDDPLAVAALKFIEKHTGWKRPTE